MTPILVSVPKVGIRTFHNLTYKEVKTLLSAKKKQRKLGVYQLEFLVEEIEPDKFNVRIEYVY